VGEHFHYFAGRINKDKRVVFPGKKAKLRKQAGLTIHAVKNSCDQKLQRRIRCPGDE
jgi:hypothetical protein